MLRKSELSSIIGKIDKEILFTAFSPLFQKIKYAEKLNKESTTYLSLEYQEKPLAEGQSQEGDLLIRGLRNLELPFEVFSGQAVMEQVSFTMEIYHRKDPIFKVYDPKSGFSMEYRPDALLGSKGAYVLFFKREKEKQGNYFEFKKFIKEEISPLLFQEADYEYIFGKAIWSSNSEIRFSHKGDWRTKKRLWNGKEVTGLQYAYLLMGFRPMPSDPTGQLLVLPK